MESHIQSNQIKIFVSINNDDNNRYSTYKGNIVMCIIIHLHTFKYIYTHTYYRGQMIHGVLFIRGDGHSGIICRWQVHHPRYL